MHSSGEKIEGMRPEIVRFGHLVLWHNSACISISLLTLANVTVRNLHAYVNPAFLCLTA